MNVIEAMLQQQYGFEIVDHRIQFLGHCRLPQGACGRDDA